MKQFLKIAAAVFIAMSAREFVILGLKKLEASMEGIEDVPNLGATSKAPTAASKKN